MNRPSAAGAFRIGIVSDIHYAGPAEQQRRDYLVQGIDSRAGRLMLRTYRRFLWLRDPFAHNHLLDQFIQRAADSDLVIANGDYSCDSAFIGVSDPAACASAHECLTRLRSRFPDNFFATIGDHELGKSSFGGGLGGLRLASLQAARTQLDLQPFWLHPVGRYRLLGITSSLAAFPVLQPEAPASEHPEWLRLHHEHLQDISRAFHTLGPDERVICFCHDPTALPFLWRLPAVRNRASQIELTVIGHLHSQAVLWKSRLLAGMPVIRFLGTTPRRLSAALNQARHWNPFNVVLCPATAGTQLLHDGGYATLELDPNGRSPARFQVRSLRKFS